MIWCMEDAAFTLLIAAIGAGSALIGSLIGALVPASIAKQTARRTWNQDRFAVTERFYADALSSAFELAASHRALVDDYVRSYSEARSAVALAAPTASSARFVWGRPPELIQRVQAATAAFRAQLAAGAFVQDETTHEAMSTIDSMREELVLLMNDPPGPEEALSAAHRLHEAVSPLQRSATIAAQKHNILLANTLGGLRGRKNRITEATRSIDYQRAQIEKTHDSLKKQPAAEATDQEKQAVTVQAGGSPHP